MLKKEGKQVKFGLKKIMKKTEKVEYDTTALVYSLKTVKIDREELLGINKHALNILNSILTNENSLASEVETIEDKGKRLYASIQIVLEAADVLTEYAKGTNEKINIGIDEVNSIIGQLSEFTQSTTNILSFIQPFNDYSQKIGSITEIIFNIAQMTESAARNAGIKAYHAGEHGRGFEVIADRMLMLANKTFKLTQKIPQGIQKIQEYTSDIIDNINQTKVFAESMKTNIDELNFRLKNIEDNLKEIVTVSAKIKDFVSLQDNNKSAISSLNEEAQTIIQKSVSSGERLSTVVKTQADIKAVILNLMEQIDTMIDLINKNKNVKPVISAELKFFNKLEHQLENSRHISEQIISVIDEFIEFNVNQVEFINGYKKNIDAIEDNERMITTNIQDIDDNISLLTHAVKQFTEDINTISEQIISMKDHIKDLIAIFRNVSMNLNYILDTSNELKELSESTRLLSLYASIEAARAGKFQQSLAVIVDQTKELIVKASEASIDINKIITNMQLVIDNINTIIETELESSKNIEYSINNSKDIVSHINESSSNLKNLISEIYDALNAQSDISRDIMKSYTSIKSETQSINDKAQDLYGLLKQDLTKNNDNIEMTKGIRKNISKKYDILRSQEKNVYRMVLKDPPRHWVPCLVGDSMSNYVLQMIHSGLVKFGKESNVIPAVAKFWQINEDATEWIFYLRDNVHFHDGTLLTAEDVKETFYRVMDSQSAPFINMIKGADAYLKRRIRIIEGIQVIDDFTIKFVLDYPYIPFIANLAIVPMSIIKRDMVHYSDEQFQKNPIGCGPFIVESFDGKEFKANANQDYYEGEPYLDAVHIRFGEEHETFPMILANKIDFAELSSTEYDKLQDMQRSDVKMLSKPSLDLQYIGFNMLKSNELTTYKELRQALNYATDKSRYIAETMGGGGIPAKGVFPPSHSAYNKFLQGYPYNPDKAKDLLREVGFPNGIKRVFELTCSKTTGVMKRAEMLKQMWEEIGIKIKINPLSWRDLLDKMHGGRTEIFMMGWAADTGEADNFLYPLFHSESKGNGGNDCFYDSRKVDSLIVTARKTTNPDKREEIFREIEKILIDDAPMVFLTHNYNRVVVRNHIHGYYVHPLHIYPVENIWKEWSENE